MPPVPKHDCKDKYDNVAIHVDFGKCIGCNSCVRACDEQGVSVYTKNEKQFWPPHIQNNDLLKSNCIHCGQCAHVCPVNAIVPTNGIARILDAHKAGKQLIALIAPSTRYGIGEMFGQKPDKNNTGNMIRALKEFLHFDKVFDVNYGADETTVLDTKEAMHHFKEGKMTFTSCCPAWVNIVEHFFPQLLPYVSTAKSCVEMLSAQVRKLYPDAFVVEVMPCTAKKGELLNHGTVDVCITVVELGEYLKEQKVTNDYFAAECNTDYDAPFNKVSGGSYIFGRIGGVALNVVRELAHQITGKFDSYERLDDIPVELPNYKIAMNQYKIGEETYKVLVLQGGKQIFQACEQIRDGKLKPDVIECMACQGGCQNGGGMPKNRQYQARGAGMDRDDENTANKVASGNETLMSHQMSHHDIEEMYERSYEDKSKNVF